MTQQMLYHSLDKIFEVSVDSSLGKVELIRTWLIKCPPLSRFTTVSCHNTCLFDFVLVPPAFILTQEETFLFLAP